MKDATFTGDGPHIEKEVEAEIDRLGAEIRQMLENTTRNQEATARRQAATWETIRWLEERINVGKAA